MSLPADQDFRSSEPLSETEIEQIEIRLKYAGYINRQKVEVDRHLHYENQKIPLDMNYDLMTNLSFEARDLLKRHRPETIGQASRIQGVTPAAISLLLIQLKRLQQTV